MLFHILHSNEVFHQYVDECEFADIAWLSNSDHICDRGNSSLQCEFFYVCSSQRWWQRLLHKFHKKCPLFCMDSSNVVCQGGILCEKFSTVDTSKPSAPHHICKGFHTTAKNPVDIKLCLLYNTESIHEYCPSTSSRITTSSSSDSA